MRYRVVWDNLAKARLVEVWMRATDRTRATEEYEAFESRVLRDPSRVGWPYEEAILPDGALLDVILRADGLPPGLRLARMSESAVLFSVVELDRTVFIWTIFLDDPA